MSKERVRPTLPLPQELMLPVRRRPTLLVIAATLLIPILLNYLAGAYLERYPINRTNWLRTTKWTILNETEAPLAWMFLGDSSCNQGMVSDRVGEQLGGQARNLCTTGNMILVDDVMMLEEHIARAGVPDNVVVIHTWDIWQRDIGTESLGMLPLEWGYWQARDIVVLNRSQEWDIWQIRNLPLISQNRSLQKVVRVELPAGRLFSRTFEHDESGYMQFPDEWSQPDRAIREAETILSGFADRDFYISRINRDLLIRMRTLADSHGFRLIFANGPLADILADDERFDQYRAAHDAFFATFTESSPQLHYIPGFVAVSPAYTIGIDHTTHSGAVQFTDQMIVELGKIVDE